MQQVRDELERIHAEVESRFAELNRLKEEERSMNAALTTQRLTNPAETHCLDSEPCTHAIRTLAAGFFIDRGRVFLSGYDEVGLIRETIHIPRLNWVEESIVYRPAVWPDFTRTQRNFESNAPVSKPGDMVWGFLGTVDAQVFYGLGALHRVEENVHVHRIEEVSEYKKEQMGFKTNKEDNDTTTKQVEDEHEEEDEG
ncbi:hypothetical protein BDW74DRAFT_180183 [Aspergillus multicolor]|uniref:uncharacterized protein n=1 Tax=Aspergillus multicolor TaxID=41759 RepID=UPI003CCD05E6